MTSYNDDNGLKIYISKREGGGGRGGKLIFVTPPDRPLFVSVNCVVRKTCSVNHD